MSQETALNIEVNVGKALKPYQAVITKLKRKKFLTEYAKDGNFTRAATSIGVTRQSVYELIKRDKNFANAYQIVEDALLDAIESTRLSLALQFSRDGHQDAKMLLKAKRPEIYGDKLQVEGKHTVTHQLSPEQLEQILQKQNLTQAKQDIKAIPDAEIEILPG